MASIPRKKVKFPSKSVNKHGFAFAHADIRQEVYWHLTHSPGTRWKKIDKIKFIVNDAREADGCVKNVHWGWALPLYNLWKLLSILGYKDMETMGSQHAHIYRYNDVNESVLNLAHALLKDFRIPHLRDSEDDDDDVDVDDPALPSLAAFFALNPNVPPPFAPSFASPSFPPPSFPGSNLSIP